MARPAHPGPTERELLLLKILWDQGPSTVADIHRAFPKKPKPAYTSLQTNLQTMVDKGYLTRDTQNRSYVYASAVTRQAVERKAVGDLLRRVFDGSALRLLTTALAEGSISAEEVKELQALIEEREARG